MVKNDRQSRNKKRCCKVRVGVWEDEWLSIGTTKLQRSQIDFFGRCWLFPCFQPAFALLRTLMFLLMVKVTYNAFLWEMEYNDGNWAYFFLFFSYWSLIVEVLYLACATSLSWSYGTTGIHLESFNAITFKPLRAPDYVSPLLTCTWILQNIALPTSAFTCFAYWATFNTTFDFWSGSTQVHGWNFLVMLIDICLSGSQMRISHCYHCVLFGICWFAMSIFHGPLRIGNGTRPGELLYDHLDYWNKPWQTLPMALGTIFIVLPASYFLIAAVYWAARFLAVLYLGGAHLIVSCFNDAEADTIVREELPLFGLKKTHGAQKRYSSTLCMPRRRTNDEDINNIDSMPGTPVLDL